MNNFNRIKNDLDFHYSSDDSRFLPRVDSDNTTGLIDLIAKFLTSYYAFDVLEIVSYLEANSELDELEILVNTDLQAVIDRDPACKSYAFPILYLKGFHGVFLYRLANFALTNNYTNLAYRIQFAMCTSLSIDINPNAVIGEGLFLDHATGIVIGETSILGKDVSILQSVTLGGTGKETGKRHPNIGDGVLLGAGSKVLGNITVGNNVKVAAGSVVLKDIPDNVTVVGAPARIVARHHSEAPSRSMDQLLK